MREISQEHWGHPSREMSGLCEVPTSELASCTAHTHMAFQRHKSLPCTHRQYTAALAVSLWLLQPLPEAGRHLSPAVHCPALPSSEMPRGMRNGHRGLGGSKKYISELHSGLALWPAGSAWLHSSTRTKLQEWPGLSPELRLGLALLD